MIPIDCDFLPFYIPLQNKNQHAQLLISGKSVSQYASFSAHYTVLYFCVINREEIEKDLYNQSSQHGKYTDYLLAKAPNY